MINKITTNNERETENLGEKIWNKYKSMEHKKAIIFGLEGELGSGKTQFVKSLTKTMGIKDQPVSPTFTLEAEYDLGRLIHIDAWRMENENELLKIGFEKRIKDRRVIVIEWAEKLRKIIKKQTKGVVVVWLKFEYGEKKNQRIISWKEL